MNLVKMFSLLDVLSMIMDVNNFIIEAKVVTLKSLRVGNVESQVRFNIN